MQTLKEQFGGSASHFISRLADDGDPRSDVTHPAGFIKASKVNIGTAALLIAGIALGGGAISEALIAGSQAAGAHMQLKFSRQDEEEEEEGDNG